MGPAGQGKPCADHGQAIMLTVSARCKSVVFKSMEAVCMLKIPSGVSMPRREELTCDKLAFEALGPLLTKYASILQKAGS